MPKKIRANVLRLPQGIKPESVQRAGEVVQAFTEHLRALGSVKLAVAKTTKETGVKAETKTTQTKDKK